MPEDVGKGITSVTGTVLPAGSMVMVTTEVSVAGGSGCTTNFVDVDEKLVETTVETLGELGITMIIVLAAVELDPMRDELGEPDMLPALVAIVVPLPLLEEDREPGPTIPVIVDIEAVLVLDEVEDSLKRLREPKTLPVEEALLPVLDTPLPLLEEDREPGPPMAVIVVTEAVLVPDKVEEPLDEL